MPDRPHTLNAGELSRITRIVKAMDAGTVTWRWGRSNLIYGGFPEGCAELVAWMVRNSYAQRCNDSKVVSTASGRELFAPPKPDDD